MRRLASLSTHSAKVLGPKPRQGTVIIVVLVIVILISLAAYNFTLSMESEHLATRNGGDRLACRQAAFSVAEVLASIMERPRSQRMTDTLPINQTIDLWPDDTDSADESDWKLQAVVYQGPNANGSESPQRLLTESAKLNLRSLGPSGSPSPDSLQQNLLRLPGMTAETATAILQRLGGSMRNPGKPVDAGPAMVELLPQRTSDSSSDSDNPSDTWRTWVTMCSAERNETFEGLPRININGESLTQLHQQLSKRVPLPVANYIVLARQHGIEKSSSANTPLDSVNVDLNRRPVYRFESLAELFDSAVSVSVSNRKRQSVASPIDRVNGAAGMDLARLLDQLTLTSARRLVGRVDVATAPVEVLAAVPGLDTTSAGAIVNARSSDSNGWVHPIAALAASGLSATVVDAALPYLTVGGDVVKVTVVGRLGDHGPSYRCRVLVDASWGKTRWSVLSVQ
ncbi:type II secretion system protein GspK [Crateriforma conspicua]|uniref:General secretion pathway protein K n=1 Tax=Crateriforma conspicua TaxID=2527996 RepID=A0A5C6FW49_9PLAN|nr:type II secretion system protein GspK [Crateriforma conspicua]TWU65640.1 General secretion pathway protein K [Crateriforma conspicua]